MLHSKQKTFAGKWTNCLLPRMLNYVLILVRFWSTFILNKFGFPLNER